MVKSGLLYNVKDLQASLFQPCRTAGTYLSSFLQNTLKTNQIEINTDNKTLKPIAKLKEPRDLFALSKELDCSQQAARWPSECQVLEGRVQHIEYAPPVPEQYYHPTGKEIQPKPVGEEAGTVVFQYYPISAVNYFSRSCVGGSRYFLPACPNDADNNDDLKFESRFESGNLAKVVKITETYYEFYLRTDMYTNRHMQWFYFRIQNTKKHIIYRFSFVNLSKGDSLYSVGMKPLLYSTKDAQLSAVGWRRCGDNITFYKNDPISEDEDEIPNYTLSFNIEFPHDQDEVYLAHCYPYTYTDLQDYLNKLQHHPVKSNFTKLRLLCRTLAGNNVYYVTITEPPLCGEPKKKKAVVVTARVHPGETPSSWMMKGFIDFLTGNSNPAKELREKFIFKLVPMLNPDGVIVGNNRCSLTGRDLNRQYRTVIRETYPPVWHTKLMIRRLIEECGIAMYCDLHAHSRNHNVFIYGCENKRYLDKRLQEQVFPLMLHKNAADKFSFENCKFRIQRSKEGTGRVVVWMMGVTNSYTMEASFAGSTLGSRVDTHFNVQDFESMGRAFCETLLDFCDEEPSKVIGLKEKLRLKIKERLVKEGSNADEPTNISLSDYSSDEGDRSSSSIALSQKSPNLNEKEENSEYKLPETQSNQALHNSTLSKHEGSIAKQKSQVHIVNILKKTANVEKTPQMPRKPLQVHKTILDPPCIKQTIDGFCFTSELDSEEESVSLQKEYHKFKINKGKRKIKRRCIPQEQNVKSPQATEVPDTIDRIKAQALKQKEAPKVQLGRHANMSEKYPFWHQKKYFEANSFKSEKPIQDLTTEIRLKIGNTLKQKIWTGCPSSTLSEMNFAKEKFLNFTHWTKGPFVWATSILPSHSNKLKSSKLSAQQCVQKVFSASKDSAEVIEKRKETWIKKTQKYELSTKENAKKLPQRRTKKMLDDMRHLCIPVRNDPLSQVALLKLSEQNASKLNISNDIENIKMSKHSKLNKNTFIMAAVTRHRTDTDGFKTHRSIPEKFVCKKKKKRKTNLIKKSKQFQFPLKNESSNQVLEKDIN